MNRLTEIRLLVHRPAIPPLSVASPIAFGPIMFRPGRVSDAGPVTIAPPPPRRPPSKSRAPSLPGRGMNRLSGHPTAAPMGAVANSFTGPGPVPEVTFPRLPTTYVIMLGSAVFLLGRTVFLLRPAGIGCPGHNLVEVPTTAAQRTTAAGFALQRPQPLPHSHPLVIAPHGSHRKSTDPTSPAASWADICPVDNGSAVDNSPRNAAAQRPTTAPDASPSSQDRVPTRNRPGPPPPRQHRTRDAHPTSARIRR